tara:strand:+ start:3642 stop:5639 length:1998 start_codon:yes stop_codon:yes gene_type:complete
MANWTVSTSTTSVVQSSSVSGGTKVLTISPNVGYVLSAANFKIGGATETSANVWGGGNLDSTITQVQFADTGIAGDISNTVTATVTFTSFTMNSGAAGDKILYIDIDEDVAVDRAIRNFCIASQHTAETNGSGVNAHTVTYASAPSGITTVVSSGSSVFNLGDGGVEHRSSGGVPEGTAYPGNQIFQVTFAANTVFGFFYLSPPAFSIAAGQYSSYYEVIDSNSTFDSNNNLVSIVYTAHYTPPVGVTGLDPDPMSSAGAMCELGHSIAFSHILRQKPGSEPGTTLNVTNVISDTSDVISTGDSRNIKVVGDIGTIFKLVLTRTADGHTYDFSTNTFTSGATTSTETTLGSSGLQDFNVTIPLVTSDATYDITIVPTSPTSTSSGVPLVAGDFRLSQFARIDVSLDMLDGANKYIDADLPAPVVITGEAKKDVIGSIDRTFSFTITPAMVTDAGTNTLAVKSSLDFSLDDAGSTATALDGNATSATFDVDDTTGILAGASINWEVVKAPIFSGDFDSISIGEYDATKQTTEPNVDNLVAGMILTSASLSSTETVTITSVGESSIRLSSKFTFDTRVPITFTASGITVSSVTDGDTLVASQSLAGVKDNLSLQFGGGGSDVSSDVFGGTVTKVGNNIVITGNFKVNSFSAVDKTVKIDLNKLITIS